MMHNLYGRSVKILLKKLLIFNLYNYELGIEKCTISDNKPTYEHHVSNKVLRK
jgi:hypothetical protein